MTRRPRPSNWKATLGRFEIHTKTGREKFLEEVARTYEGMYPGRAAFFKTAMRRLREVTTDGYRAGAAGEMFCKIRVPTELWLFIQRWIPDFGNDSADVELLSRVWCDLVPARRGRDPRRRTTLPLSTPGGRRHGPVTRT